ncbi:hypothetical protein DL765_002091 [Monosporascus sp. GIB2]|nr:hypothetical protein DL765_002091 [Monosporascus sp. GIB2]
MRFSTLSLGLLALLTPLTSAWSKEDREIFRLRDEIATHEGSDITFYDFLGVTPSANQDEINKAVRKRSKALHPDKVKAQLTAERTKANKAKNKGKKKPGVTVTKPPTQAEINAAVKAASERQSRINIVGNILKGPGRARYDHFLANGFPVWKGTEYYYNRYRPGLGTVLVGCLIVGGGGFHYLALYMSWKRQREFVERYIKFARHAAWGDNMAIPGLETAPAAVPVPAPDDDDQQPMMPMNRRQRRMQERDARKESGEKPKRAGRRGRAGQQASGSATPVPQTQGSSPTGARKRVVAENGKVLVVDSLGDVYLEQEDDDGNVGEFLLDPSELPQPTIKDTALFKLPFWIYAATIGKALPLPKGADNLDDQVEEDEAAAEQIADDSSSSDAAQRTPSTDSAEDFELLDKSVDELGKPKTTGSQPQGSGKAKKRNKKR